MNIIPSVAALALALGLAGAAHATSPVTAGSPPSGGVFAKGNAPLKPTHTINDGQAKPGANSFTEKEARTHILHSGYTAVSPLTKGPDGVWRGMATTKAGASVNVGLDFKGNVSESGGPTAALPNRDKAAPAPMATTSTNETSSTTSTSATKTSPVASTHRVHHRHRHGVRCAHPGPNGVACSGIDRNDNGISDKEDRAIHNGANP